MRPVQNDRKRLRQRNPSLRKDRVEIEQARFGDREAIAAVLAAQMVEHLYARRGFRRIIRSRWVKRLK